MLALHDLESEQCGGCGGDLTETTAADAEYGYAVPPPARCHRCHALGLATSPEAVKPYPEPHSALLFTAVRKGRR